MNKIHRKIEYALMGLKHMHGKSPGELTTVKELTLQYQVPFDATARVLQVLAQKGVLRSEQGAHGGYQIQRDLHRVSLFELMEWLIGPMGIAKCLQEAFGEDPCELKSTCNIVSPMHNLNKKLLDFYKTISILEILDPRSVGAKANDKSGADKHSDRASDASVESRVARSSVQQEDTHAE